ncbi:MAG: D-aminoacyl-tRNA deacylase [Candidatus Nanopelagicales bacterium]
MRAVVQRSHGAKVSVAGEVIGRFQGLGLVVLVGVAHGDTEAVARRLAGKLHGLRIFDGPDGREVSIGDLGLPAMVISQFTLYGQLSKGRRPTWELAAPATVAETLVAAVVDELRALGTPVETGRFGADMQIDLINDGPVTLILDV